MMMMIIIMMIIIIIIIMGTLLGVDHALAPPTGRQARLGGAPKD